MSFGEMTDCHVASLLAMTNTIHVASLLAMTSLLSVIPKPVRAVGIRKEQKSRSFN